MSHDCCVALPRGAMDLFAVCDCGFTSSYPLFLTKMPGLVCILITRMTAFVACECLIVITFLISLDPDQALQSAVPDLEPHCVISKCVSNIYTLSPYFLCNPL